MAVYTHVDPDDLAGLVARYDIGTVISCKGIAEGVENSNFLLETSGGRFILTLYEKRVQQGDLPFFVDLLDHLAARGCPVPAMIRDRDGIAIQKISERAACLIQFLPGISLTHPTEGQCHAAGAALGAMHRAVADFSGARENSMGRAHWRGVAEATGNLDAVLPGLQAIVDDELAFLDANWPMDIPAHVIHADLFPDIVLMLGDTVSGLIDFYFACNDLLAYDVAICLNAWCFEPDGSYNQTKGRALLAADGAERPLGANEIAALPLLARGAALRFLLTRLYDWLMTPAGALVRKKDPLEYYRKLRFHRTAANAAAYGLELIGDGA